MQTTLRKPISLVGTGLHSGRPVRMRLLPRPADHGIWFCRTDVTDRDNLIQAAFDSVVDTTLCTRIGNEAGVTVSTIEHLMAAFAGCGLRNVMVEIDGPEVPILDGSARGFVRKIMQAGLRELDAPMRALKIVRPIMVSEGGVAAALLPAGGFEIDFEIDFEDAAIGHQHKALDMANGSFVRELADCRTFCRREDVEAMQAAGLALGGTLENAVVVSGTEVLNPGGFRRADECVRHKMLDALGDLALAGFPIIGRYVGSRAGHGVTNRLLRKLFATPGAHAVVTCSPEMEQQLPGFDIHPSDLAQVG